MPVISVDEQQIRREHIINAAERLFFSKGFIVTTMDEVAVEAGLHRRTLYGYFDSKDELYFVVFLRIQERKVQQLLQVIDEYPDEVGQLYAVGMFFYDFYEQNPEFLRLQLHQDFVGFASANIKPDTVQQYVRYNEIVFEKLAKTIVEGKAKGKFRAELSATQFLLTFFFSTRSILNRCLLHPDQTSIIANGVITPRSFYQEFVKVQINGIMKRGD